MTVPPGGWGWYPPQPQPRPNQLALWSMIVGIAAIPLGLCCGPLGLGLLLLGGVALTLGVVGRKQVREAQGWQTGDGQALTGIVLGAISVVGGLVIFAVFIGLTVFSEQLGL